MKITIRYNTRLEVESIKKLKEDMLMIRIMNTDPDWLYERLM